ncbi:MAG: thiamine-phosphate kinase, partial [Alphaproteobacteria bacterium]|nr:thiamine-phosphate kinase [Alphaproteobacteria bacterium]
MKDRPLPAEFELIERFFAPLAKDYPGALALADDGALIELDPGHRLVVTTDVLVAGVHFPAADPPESIARKLLRVNLSDLAAMGAEPLAYLLALALEKDTPSSWLEGFVRGLGTDYAEFAIPLVGGDTVATTGPMTLTLTALGKVAEGSALMRSAAKAGDVIFVSGCIGDGALGLMALEGRAGELAAAHRDYVIDRYRLPRPRLALGQRLVGLAHGVIDVSDGLIADLGHICQTSRLGAKIEGASLPLSDAARAALADDPGLLATLVTGGDDYELLFTIAPEARGSVGEISHDL